MRLATVAFLAALIVWGCAGMPPGDDTVENKALASRVKAALIGDPQIDAAAIGVTADDGQVRLDGFVETELERRQAERTAGGVDGVTEVTNMIEVK